MDDLASVTSMVSALWTSVALLGAGYARTRNRSALAWFFLLVFFGPVAAFFLVVLPAVEPVPEVVDASSRN
ncbi:hypothetical protein [Microbacterium immunditiarum]|uniref:Uncharacterized protein n=1 Tax=Microbacterium immunditiarum TaxID=337480 RepID=A0A7Y9GLS1_9MICO|nr:hypothetical protein [Microbacterium immunditiarum]